MTLRLVTFVSVLTMAAVTFPALAGGERIWELAGYDEFSRGELQQTVLSEKGEILTGPVADKIDLDPVGLVWSALRVQSKKSPLYLGTAYNGGVYRLDGNKANLIATTDNLVVTDMVIDANGDLLVSTIPTPTVWRITRPESISPKSPVKAEPLLTLPTQHNSESGDIINTMIWAIELDAQTDTLYMATGPEGQIWAAGRDRRPELYLDTDEKHILDIVQHGNGQHGNGIYAGTSPNALLLDVTAPGVSYAIADFDATEVKRIALLNDDALAVAVNHFTYPRTIPTAAQSGTAASVASAVTKALATGKSGTKSSSHDKGEVYRVDKTGRQEVLLEKSGTHITTIAAGNTDTIWVAMGNEGKIFAITKDRVVYEVADVAERAVMCLITGDDLIFAGTGDTGAGYLFSSQRTDHFYLSPVLDAKAIATFGKASWIATGPITVTARSGNTISPGSNWTDWSAKVANGDIPGVQSARFIQFKFEWASPSAVLLQFELFYKPVNRRAVITEFNPDTPFSNTTGASKGDAGISERTLTLRPDKANREELSLSWKVDNPDGDTLQYRLYYKPVDKKMWLPVFKEDDQYTRTSYTFETETVPEGRYHFKLTADDAIENPFGDILSDEMISVPVDIDNHPPEISDLTFRKRGNVVSGTATDSWSPIAALDYTVDGGNWHPVPALDGLLDAPQEAFRFTVEPPLKKGAHVIAVRAKDRQGNFTVDEIHLEIEEKN